MLQSTELKEAGGLRSILISDMEMQSLELVPRVFCLVLVQYFLTMLPFLPFGTVTYILCHYVLEVRDLFFFFFNYFDFIGDYS